jgi:hypothetical protein
MHAERRLWFNQMTSHVVIGDNRWEQTLNHQWQSSDIGANQPSPVVISGNGWHQQSPFEINDHW